MRPQPGALVAHCLVCGALPKPLSTVLHPTPPKLRNQTPLPPTTLGVSSEILKRYLLLFVFVYLAPLGVGQDSHAHWAEHVETRVPGVPDTEPVGTEVWAEADRSAGVEGDATP